MMWGGWGGIGHMGAGGWLGMIFMGLFWIAVVVGLVLLVRYLVRRPEQAAQYATSPGQAMGTTRSSAVHILEERYARGEIDQEEFLRRRADLTA